MGLPGSERPDEGHHQPALTESWIKDFGDVAVGFVGAVTDAPAGARVARPASRHQRGRHRRRHQPGAAARRSRPPRRADIVILLVHEGAAPTAHGVGHRPDVRTSARSSTAQPDVDAIISAHSTSPTATGPGAGVARTEGRTVTSVRWSRRASTATTSSLNFRFDTDTGELVGISQSIVPLQSGDAVWTPTSRPTRLRRTSSPTPKRWRTCGGPRPSARSRHRSTGPS